MILEYRNLPSPPRDRGHGTHLGIKLLKHIIR